MLFKFLLLLVHLSIIFEVFLILEILFSIKIIAFLLLRLLFLPFGI